MGQHVIKVPDIGEGIAEVELVAWHVKPGDLVAEDQVLADVMTDKATVEIPSPVHGQVLSLGGEVGQTLAVGSELMRLEVEGKGNAAESAAAARPAAAPAPLAGQREAEVAIAQAAPAAVRGSAAQAPRAVAAPQAGAAPSARPVAAQASHAVAAGVSSVAGDERVARHRVEPAGSAPAAERSTAWSREREPGEAHAGARDRPIASPSVRRRAWELGIDLAAVPATGPGGRIMHADLDAYAKRAGARAAGATRGIERHDEAAVPVIGLRRQIARRMQEAKRRIPHFTYVEEIDVTELEGLRARLNAQWGGTRPKLTLLPFLVRALVLAVRDFPQVNARFDDEAGVVTRHGAVHVGIATQTDAGLMVPVLRHAEARDLWDCAAEIARLAEVARAARATRDELSGSTITITSLGALGGIVSTPVINHPEVAILGVNRIVERLALRNGAVVPRLAMNLSSSFDHRVVDGMQAAQFVQAIRSMLECPATLFVEQPA